MEIAYRILLAAHIAAGTLSLVLFWIPVFSRKGKKAHILTGRLYVRSMWVVVSTAVLLCIIALLQQRFVSAGFLGFLTVLTAYPLWYGTVILNYKKAIPDFVLDIRRGLNALLMTGGIGLIAWSLVLRLQGNTILLLIFGILGLTSASAVFQSRDRVHSKAHRLGDHLEGMIASGIAAYTAFLAFGGRSLFSELLSGPAVIIPWVLPAILGTVAIRKMRRKWA